MNLPSQTHTHTLTQNNSFSFSFSFFFCTHCFAFFFFLFSFSLLFFILYLLARALSFSLTLIHSSALFPSFLVTTVFLMDDKGHFKYRMLQNRWKKVLQILCWSCTNPSIFKQAKFFTFFWKVCVCWCVFWGDVCMWVIEAFFVTACVETNCSRELPSSVGSKTSQTAAQSQPISRGKCSGCSEDVTSGRAISVLDQLWHEPCFS